MGRGDRGRAQGGSSPLSLTGESPQLPGSGVRHPERVAESAGGSNAQCQPQLVRLLGEMPRDVANEAFRAQHPDPTVLLLMRFEESPVLRRIDEAIRSACANFGRNVVRADDRDYTGELWANVALCLHNSDLVVAVLEEIDDRRGDVNVMIELGFALGSGRRCLILVESSRGSLPSVLQHRLTRRFSAYDLPRSVEREVSDWLRRDVGLTESRPQGGIQDERQERSRSGLPGPLLR